jgi:hypothetical protein
LEEDGILITDFWCLFLFAVGLFFLGYTRFEVVCSLLFVRGDLGECHMRLSKVGWSKGWAFSFLGFGGAFV